jgi:AcrR family transcriptional regulator
MSGREQILDAAAQMFSEHGYKATSTREIAEAVGVKQSSLYYHFANKQEILATLLAGTVKPSLSYANRLAGTGEPPHVQLYALTHFDVSLLSSERWNIGALYSLPELRAEPFEEFRRDRQLLEHAYRRRIVEGAGSGLFQITSADVASALVFTLVESVITMRSNGMRTDSTLPAVIARGCLRLLECADEDTAIAAAECKRLLALAGSQEWDDRGSGSARAGEPGCRGRGVTAPAVNQAIQGALYSPV